jgi:hypothetical protein
MTPKDAAKLGREAGRRELREQIIILLGLDKYITDKITQHEEQYHGDSEG